MEGARNYFVFQFGSAVDFGSYDKFVGRVSSARIRIGGLDVVTAGEGGGAVVDAEIGSAVSPMGTVIVTW